MDVLTNNIGPHDVTSATDHDLGMALNEALNLMDDDRKWGAYAGIRQCSTKERIENLEAALLALATVVSRRLGL